MCVINQFDNERNIRSEKSKKKVDGRERGKKREKSSVLNNDYCQKHENE